MIVLYVSKLYKCMNMDYREILAYSDVQMRKKKQLDAPALLWATS